MSLLRRSRFAPTVRLSRRRRLANLARNLWVLRRELWAIIRRKPPRRDPPIALTCIVCRHALTKPCRRGRDRHLVHWPDEADGLGGFKAGQLVEVRRQKPRGGAYDRDDQLRPLLNHGKPVFR